VEARLRLKRVSPGDLHLSRLPAPARRAFLLCAELPLLRGPRWYLAGGTALALQVGHRQSVDLDFFTPRARFGELALERTLLGTKRWRTTHREEGTIYGTLLGAKMSFLAYPFFVPSRRRLACGNVRVLLPRDIAAMKIIAVSQRGRKRDFIDLYWHCQHEEPLEEVIPRVLKQYPGGKHSLAHFLKSLTYFADAEGDPMPRLFFDVTWPAVRRYFEREVPRIAREVLDIRT
jgi:hypothetical protein